MKGQTKTELKLQSYPAYISLVKLFKSNGLCAHIDLYKLNTGVSDLYMP